MGWWDPDLGIHTHGGIDVKSGQVGIEKWEICSHEEEESQQSKEEKGALTTTRKPIVVGRNTTTFPSLQQNKNEGREKRGVAPK